MIISHLFFMEKLFLPLPHNPERPMEDQSLYQFSRSKDEKVCFTLREYKDRKYIDLRVFFRPKNESEMHPTKKGITIALDLFPELKKGISICEKRLVSHME